MQVWKIPEGPIRELLYERIREAGEFIWLEEQDTPEALDAYLGGCMECFEWTEYHEASGYHEVVYIFDDSGYAHVVLIPEAWNGSHKTL